jgi:hypothetical protein
MVAIHPLSHGLVFFGSGGAIGALNVSRSFSCVDVVGFNPFAFIQLGFQPYLKNFEVIPITWRRRIGSEGRVD